MKDRLYGTRLYIKSSQLESNINYIQKSIGQAEIIAMVKANAYGFGDILMTKKMKEFGINYFAVADFEEGMRLRNQSIHSPIMVMNTSKSSIEMIIKNTLEPVIYNMNILHCLIDSLKSRSNNQKINPYPIHIKINTGMNRWGFDIEEISELITKLKSYSKCISVKSIYSHLSSAANNKDHIFTQSQIQDFIKIKNEFQAAFKYSIKAHIHNSFGLINFTNTISDFHYFRIGIALYGGFKNPNLKPIGELRCRVSQIRSLKPNDSVGYNREFVAKKSMKIATIPFGYADGLQRSWGNGILKFYYKGYLLPTVGNISMDSCSIDVTDLFNDPAVSTDSLLVDDEIIYFGKERSIWDLSKELNTIPYEITATLSRRIKRIYY